MSGSEVGSEVGVDLDGAPESDARPEINTTSGVDGDDISPKIALAISWLTSRGYQFRLEEGKLLVFSRANQVLLQTLDGRGCSGGEEDQERELLANLANLPIKAVA